MIRQPVKSSNVMSVGYDADSRILEVEFGDYRSPGPGYMFNRVYHYLEVPPETHAEFMAFWSPGRYVNNHLKFSFCYLGKVGEVD
jgi:hypothetical protein